jgi:hypothetical protein
MALLISDRHVVVTGEVVYSSHRTRAAAERQIRRIAARMRRKYGESTIGLALATLRYIPPGRVFDGHSWHDVPGIRLATESELRRW